jgi:hypothetical protein
MILPRLLHRSFAGFFYFFTNRKWVGEAVGVSFLNELLESLLADIKQENSF